MINEKRVEALESKTLGTRPVEVVYLEGKTQDEYQAEALLKYEGYTADDIDWVFVEYVSP